MREKAHEAKENAKEKARRAKAKAKAEGTNLRRNSDNPVVIGNAILITLIGAGLGFGAYRKHAEGRLDWQLVGLWSGVVGAFGVADYFVSK